MSHEERKYDHKKGLESSSVHFLETHFLEFHVPLPALCPGIS